MQEVARLLSVTQLHKIPYHRMGNGLVERFNRTLKQMLRRMTQEQPKQWDRYIAPLFAYLEVPQSSPGFSPFQLVYGRAVRGPPTILMEVWTNEVTDADVASSYEYVLNIRPRVKESCRVALEELHKAKVRQAKA